MATLHVGLWKYLVPRIRFQPHNVRQLVDQNHGGWQDDGDDGNAPLVFTLELLCSKRQDSLLRRKWLESCIWIHQEVSGVSYQRRRDG